MKLHVIMHSESTVFNDGPDYSFLQFSWCSSGYSHVKYCGFNIQSCSSVCPDIYNQIELRCYGKSININKIYTVYVLFI